MTSDERSKYIVNTRTDRRLAMSPRGGSRPGSRWAKWIALSGPAVGMLSGAARADNFANVHYSARKDQLVVTMAYRGTNPNHTFALKWGQCKVLAEGGGSAVDAEILDSQWQDVEQSDFKRTTRFSLAGIPCRPAKLTLRSAPRFFYTVLIPAEAHRKP